MLKLGAVVIVSLFWFAVAPFSLAADGSQPGCGTYEVIAEMLTTAKEKRIAVYRAAMGNIEVWANAKTKAWSIVSVTIDGKGACLRATGTGYTR